MTTANVFALILVAFALPNLDGCFYQEKELDTKDDEACRQAVSNNPQITYEDCRREATAKRNAPHSKQQANY
ncbi:MAG: hypothetical protein WAL48_10765 [Xanthobacteraceae bacterium]|jgi:hypothetical protein